MRLLEDRASTVRMRIAAHGSAGGTCGGHDGSSVPGESDTGVQTSPGEHQGSFCTLSARQELSMLAHCYVHDVAGGALGRWRDAGSWLAVQPLMQHDADALAAAVAERMDGGNGHRDCGSGNVGGAAVQHQWGGLGSRPAGEAATAIPADADVGTHANGIGSLFTMTGDMECGGSGISTPRLVGAPGPVPTVCSALDGDRVAGGTNAAPMLRAHTSPTPRVVPDSTGTSGAGIGGMLASVFAQTVCGIREGMFGTSSSSSGVGAYGMASHVTAMLYRRSWELLSALVSVVMLFALVAERRSLSVAARRWWRQLRTALRDLMSMGLVLTPSTG
eukprot:364707-Chlamydomonas_euryale.AAC.16